MSVRNLLDTAFAQPAAPGTRDGGLTVTALGSGAWKEFLLGPGAGPGRSGSWYEQLAVLWKRVVAECGEAQRLANEHDIDWERLPHESKLALALSGPDDDAVDVTAAAAALATQREQWELERPAPCKRDRPQISRSGHRTTAARREQVADLGVRQGACDVG
ncbi:hypothetical protein ACFY04_13935 [Streptomyces sp. NPDC001549]|uniref:hypothetical protein n=1 Tax=Streptomyces sp. NPDC001549 TaxID=3364586 RepID=UPI0036B71D34